MSCCADILSIYAGIFSIRPLVHLNLSHNSIEVVPDELGNLENLKQLSLAANRLDYLPVTISRLINLSELDISTNCIKDLPEQISEKLCCVQSNLYFRRFCTIVPGEYVIG